jgi:aspartyl-tRNA(Asn)/glutamyl-tRNA(Gln) amidotransferase subunit A
VDEADVDINGERMDVRSALIRLTRPFNLSGHPACALPCGFTAGGLPIGLQLVGRPFDEGTLFRIGHGYQQLSDWHVKEPEP